MHHLNCFFEMKKKFQQKCFTQLTNVKYGMKKYLIGIQTLLEKAISGSHGDKGTKSIFNEYVNLEIQNSIWKHMW